MAALKKINKEFLEDVLKEPIQDFSIQAGCKPGDNVAGSVKSIIATTGKGEQKHFILKTLPEELTQENAFVFFSKAFWRENAIYQTVLPKLEEFAKSRGYDYSAPAPKHYKGYNDDKSDYVLLEDIRPRGYAMPDKTKSLTEDEMSLILKELAVLHAVGYSFIRDQGHRVFRDVDGFQYLLQPEDGSGDVIMDKYHSLVAQFFAVATTLLQDRLPEGAEKMKRYLEKFSLPKFLMEHLTNSEAFPTICHFDLWCNNMLMKHDAQGRPVGVKFIDFQFTQLGNIYSDLIYLTYTSTTPEFRKKHLNSLLNLYYNTFCSTMESLKVPLPWGFTRGSFIDQFESGIITGFVRMTFAIPLQLGIITVTKGGDKDAEPEYGHTDEGIKKMYEDSPKAIERLIALVKEMIELKYI